MTDKAARYEREKASGIDELLGMAPMRPRRTASQVEHVREEPSPEEALLKRKAITQPGQMEKTVISFDRDDLAALRRIAFEAKMSDDKANDNVSKIVRRLVSDYVKRSA